MVLPTTKENDMNAKATALKIAAASLIGVAAVAGVVHGVDANNARIKSGTVVDKHSTTVMSCAGKPVVCTATTSHVITIASEGGTTADWDLESSEYAQVQVGQVWHA